MAHKHGDIWENSLKGEGLDGLDPNVSSPEFEFFSGKDATDTRQSSAYEAEPGPSSEPICVEAPTDFEVDPAVIAAITEKVKKEVLEHLRQTSPEDGPHVEIHAPPTPSQSTDPEMSHPRQRLKVHTPVLPASSVRPDQQRKGIQFGERGDRVPNPRVPLEEWSPIDQKWGRLFDGKGNPTPRLGQLLRGIANLIINEFPPRKSLVISPAKMAAFYQDYASESEEQPWLSIFRADLSTSVLYQDLGCEHHLVQKDPKAAPSIPSLTAVGFAHWMTIQVLAYPEAEWRRLQKVVRQMPVDADGELVDGKPERLPKQLSRYLLPEREDRRSKRLLDESVENLFEKLGIRTTPSASTSTKPYSSNTDGGHMSTPEPVPRRTSSPPLKRFGPFYSNEPHRTSRPPVSLDRWPWMAPNKLHTPSGYAPSESSSTSTSSWRSQSSKASSIGSTMSFPPPPGPSMTENYRESRDERQYRRDLDDKRLPGEFNGPRDAERWDRDQETRSVETHVGPVEHPDKLYGRALVPISTEDTHETLSQLVACGDQSAGKSSVLEALTEIPFPRNENLGTRLDDFYRDTGNMRRGQKPTYQLGMDQIREPSLDPSLVLKERLQDPLTSKELGHPEESKTKPLDPGHSAQSNYARRKSKLSEHIEVYKDKDISYSIPSVAAIVETPSSESVKSRTSITNEVSHKDLIQSQTNRVEPTRLSALIEPKPSSEDLRLSSESEEMISGPHLFVQNPKMYQEDIASLQQRIFDLGEPALRNLQDCGERHVLYPPGSIPSDTSDAVRTLIMANLDLIAATNEGLNILAKEDFCDSMYNVIVSDPDRADVLRVIPIKKATLLVLTDLLQELASYYESPKDDNRLAETLDDIEETTRLILLDLGLDMSPDHFDGPLSNRTDIASQMVSSTLSILFLGLVSFITSHLCMDNGSANIIGQSSFTQLMIPTPTGPIYMTPRRLLCLDGFIKSPVWTFETVPASDPISHVSVDDGRRYYLSIFLADLADLWGPLRLGYLDGSTDLVSEVLVRGGEIIRTATDPGVTLVANETQCHWCGWTDIKSDRQNVEREPICTTNRLLIGTPGIHVGLNDQRFLVSKTCACVGRKRYTDSRNTFELQTRIPSWSLAERTAQVSGGAYINLLYGHTWKFNAGWTMKDVIVVDWVDQVRDPSHVPKPFYLDYLVVLDISRCTGHSRRVSLWSLFREDSMRKYIRQSLDKSLYRDFETLIEFFPREASFVHVWQSISKEGQDVFKTVSREVLTILRSTGVGEDGSLQAWDVSSSNRLDGRKVRPPWGAMVKDDSACATFAIITDKCVSVTATTPPPSPPNNAAAAFSPILNTIICITTEETVLSLDPCVYTPPSSLKEEDVRPEWALTAATFDKWKVKLSEDDSSPLAASRKHIMESRRDQAGPEPEALKRIENRRLARQSRQRPSMNGDATSYKQSSKDSSFSNGTSPKSPSEKTAMTQKFDKTSPSRPFPNPGRRLICDGSFDFKNGKNENVGKLILEPPQVMDLRTIAEGSILSLRWEERKSGLLNAIKAKEKVIDKRVAGWTERRLNGVLPWAVSRMAESCTTEPFVVEHIRGGTLGAGQRVVQAYIS
ncbi:uncharacterized protein PAC_08402 [Phialocephala subalpina]|uniref:DUF7514 domain-containing protein n=1 Tax=Phialocephala subalpina TaxID=576137 RepID=A0A1L7X0G3_9HELO|nr:uncharacterized protein PAC_08402 [Phialocephala subalpina]